MRNCNYMTGNFFVLPNRRIPIRPLAHIVKGGTAPIPQESGDRIMLSRQYSRRMTGKCAKHTRPGETVRPAGCHRTHPLRRTVLLFAVLTLALLFAADLALRAGIRETLRYQGQIAASRTLAAEVQKILEPMELTYGDLAQVTRDAAGKINSIEMNMAQLNLIKSRLEQGVTGALDGEGIGEIRLPLGTLLGNEYLLGRGPLVTVRLQPMGLLQTEFESHFQSAGINQTSHRIELSLTLSLTTLAPLHRAETTVTTNFILADTIIVGEVPEYYTSITGGLPGSGTADASEAG